MYYVHDVILPSVFIDSNRKVTHISANIQLNTQTCPSTYHCQWSGIAGRKCNKCYSIDNDKINHSLTIIVLARSIVCMKRIILCISLKTV